ncbi:MAG: hypothetical protein WBA93_30955 [Microcoleaceae cyanobacterium]
MESKELSRAFDKVERLEQERADLERELSDVLKDLDEAKKELKDLRHNSFLNKVRKQLSNNNLDEACRICDENCVELNDIILQL